MAARSVTYANAGVDTAAADRFVESVGNLAGRTRRPEVIAGVGGFAGLCALPSGLRDPVLVASTDGVGTKVEVAKEVGDLSTLGVDLVAMCVNDVLTCGAEPLFFLDYYATGKLKADEGQALLSGIADGCVEAQCALLGGETAEMPGSLAPNQFELAGFAVGVVERAAILPASGERGARPGDVLLGLPSSGLHANGFSLVRKVMQATGVATTSRVEGLPQPLGVELLRPTRIYARAVRALMAQNIALRALAHITGGGIEGNLVRVLPRGVEAQIATVGWTPPPIFAWIARQGPVEASEMFRTFNMGVGLIAVVSPQTARAAQTALQHIGEESLMLGELVSAADRDAPAKVVYR